MTEQTEQIYFAVVRRNGRESPQLFYDIVPPVLLQRENKELVYCTRLEGLPGGNILVTQPLSVLFQLYQAIKMAGKLPPDQRGAKKHE